MHKKHKTCGKNGDFGCLHGGENALNSSTATKNGYMEVWAMTKEVISYLKDSVAQARFWMEACLDEDDESFRQHARAILRQALVELRMNSCPKKLHDLIAFAFSATFKDAREANEHLQCVYDVLQVLEVKIAEEVSRNASEAAKAATTTD
jgi:DNA-binding GntR family transcriptional regulator